MTERAGTRLWGTDFLVDGVLEPDSLAAALSDILGLALADIVLADHMGFGAEHADATDAYFAALGTRDVAVIHVPPQPSNLAFKVDLEFVRPLPVARMQALADAADLTVLLSRDILFPEEAGQPAGEGYLVFRKGRRPSAASIVWSDDEDEPYGWAESSEPLPPLR